MVRGELLHNIRAFGGHEGVLTEKGRGGIGASQDGEKSKGKMRREDTGLTLLGQLWTGGLEEAPQIKSSGALVVRCVNVCLSIYLMSHNVGTFTTSNTTSNCYTQM
jgi:hypothetical protein